MHLNLLQYLYKKNIIYIVEKLNFALENNNISYIHLDDFSSVKDNNILDFLENKCKYSQNTLANRYNKLIRILSLFDGNKYMSLKEGILSEKKTKISNGFNINELVKILYSLFNLEDINLTIIWYFVYNLGLDIYESSNIIIKNISIKKRKMKLKRQNIFTRRNINKYILSLLEILIKEN